MKTFLICLVVGWVLGMVLPVEYWIWKIEMWYKNKYGEFTPGDGSNYFHIFRRDINIK